jgi:hypothetical protein
MLMIICLIVGSLIGMGFHPCGGIPAMYCYSVWFFIAAAATMDLPFWVSEGAGAGTLFLAAGARRLAAEQPSGGGATALAPAPAPKGGSYAWSPGEARRDEAFRNRPAGPL